MIERAPELSAFNIPTQPYPHLNPHRDTISKSIEDPILGKTLSSLIVVLNWDSLGVLSFVTTLMSCCVSSNGFIALHSNLSHVTDHWGISLNSSAHKSNKRTFRGHVLKDQLQFITTCILIWLSSIPTVIILYLSM